MSLDNLRTSFTNDLIPAYVVDLDARHLIEAVLAGYTNRLADLRSLASRYSTFVEADPAPYTVVVATVRTEAGVIVNRVLDIQPSTPTDPADLAVWAAGQLGVPEEQVLSAVIGTDAYRTTSIDSVQLLASTLGATLYPPAIGNNDLTRFSLQTFFPRLKLRGTPKSFDILARIYGFDEARMTPLWGRASARDPKDIGSQVNAQDFTPVSDVPPEHPDYDPSVHNDGPYYHWDSGTLSLLPAASDYALNVNGANPFVVLSRETLVARVPAAGTLTLVGGDDALQAAVTLGGGFVARALKPGASYNGMPLVVTPTTGSTFKLEVDWPLSLAKYRSSHFDLSVATDNPPTAPAGINQDLADNPTLVADGTAVSPWTPWSGPLPRVQAPVGTRQVDAIALRSAAMTAISSADDVRAATRTVRQAGFGVSQRDTLGFSPYTGIVSGFGTAQFPPGAVSSFSATISGQPGVSQLNGSGTVGMFGSGSAIGSVNFLGGGASLPGKAFQLVLERPLTSLPASGTILDSTRQYYDRPLELVSTSGTTQLNTNDDFPWLRPQAAGGAPVNPDFFTPVDGDPYSTLENPELVVRTTSHVNVRPVVLDYAALTSTKPYGYRLRPTDDQESTTGYATRNGTQVAVIASGDQVFDAGRWTPALHESLGSWLPLTDHPDATPVTIKAAAGAAPLRIRGVSQYDRQYTAAGWALRLAPGACIEVKVAELAQAAAMRVVTDAPTVSREIMRSGDFTVSAYGSYYVSSIYGTTYLAVPRPAAEHLVGFSYDSGGAVLFAGTQYAQLGVGEWPGDGVSADFTLKGIGATIQDVVVWRAPKSIASMRAAFDGTAVVNLAHPLAEMTSLHGMRYTLSVNPRTGFAEPSPVADVYSTSPRGRVKRYTGDGAYAGDPKFKLVGLGQGSPKYATVTLGLEGLDMPGDGQVVFINGTASALPGAARGFPAYSAVAQVNTVTDHFDTVDRQRGASRVALTGTAASVAWAATPVARASGTSVIDRPTGALGAAYTSGTTLVVNFGTVAQGQGPAIGLTSPPVYVYLHEQRQFATVAYPRWLDPTPYGTAMGVAALESNGVMTFSNTEALAAGRWAIDLSTHNVGLLDSSFDGFDVELTLEAPGVALSIPAILQPDASGLSTAGTTRVAFVLATAISGSWIMRLRWFNARTVPAKGQARRLALDSYTVVRLQSKVYSAAVVPALTTLNTGAPGAFVSRINSYGTQVAITHEAEYYSREDATVAAANRLTGSTAGRKDFRTGALFQLPDAAAPAPVTCTEFSISRAITLGWDGLPDSAWVTEDHFHVVQADSPINSRVNIGDYVRFTGSAYGGVAPLRYLWSVGDFARVTSAGTQTDWRVTTSGTHRVQMTAIDQFGDTCVSEGTLTVNVPPRISSISAVPSVPTRRTPFSMSVNAVVQDGDGDSLQVGWYKDGVAVASGTAASILVERDCTLMVAALDSLGAVVTAPVPVMTRPGRPPIVSISEYANRAKAAAVKRLLFRATVADPDNRGLQSSQWSFWDGTTASGTLLQSGTGLYYAEIMREFGAGFQGQARFDFSVQDNVGRTGSSAGIVELIFPSAPVIERVYTDVDAVTAGQQVEFICVATSPLGLGLSHRWSFSTGLVLFGARVTVDTAGLSGQVLTGACAVSDGEEQAIADARPVQVS